MVTLWTPELLAQAISGSYGVAAFDGLTPFVPLIRRALSKKPHVTSIVAMTVDLRQYSIQLSNLPTNILLAARPRAAIDDPLAVCEEKPSDYIYIAVASVALTGGPAPVKRRPDPFVLAFHPATQSWCILLNPLHTELAETPLSSRLATLDPETPLSLAQGSLSPDRKTLTLSTIYSKGICFGEPVRLRQIIWEDAMGEDEFYNLLDHLAQYAPWWVRSETSLDETIAILGNICNKKDLVANKALARQLYYRQLQSFGGYNLGGPVTQDEFISALTNINRHSSACDFAKDTSTTLPINPCLFE
ncbi:hypothetical protein LTR56_027391 [Elasticomyces elasticus]|nr:hypothetical protein LTR56_027391 [Elasticomyces elasticus]KAK4908135.1 hypothetical protein LTR49_022914 [Elasticomyces elasticus]KAK5748182.1 hypothetical protein LTS12_021782 [Elasticomyces elasticus]